MPGRIGILDFEPTPGRPSAAMAWVARLDDPASGMPAAGLDSRTFKYHLNLTRHASRLGKP